jgi:hypothetical protein
MHLHRRMHEAFCLCRIAPVLSAAGLGGQIV